ncbi:MAG: hypothetical protein BMS9Abin05_1341 [Rhodothermia bacterium]|nr:MAG: hypothetical protein BMS9Abin05_1341 [Rhodothermia bacterium]
MLYRSATNLSNSRRFTDIREPSYHLLSRTSGTPVVVHHSPFSPSALTCTVVCRIGCFVLLGVLSTNTVFAQTRDADPVDRRLSIEAVFAENPPRVDGRLDDDIWQSIEPVRGFLQRWPDEGASPTEDTWAKIAYDRDFLYFAFKFSDREPELIRAHNLERGGRNGFDDHAYIGLDTFLDGRNAYLFEINALGTQDDAMISDESMSMDAYSWDAVFRSETVIDNEGWTLEVSIPFRQLRFPDGEELEFGLFMRRTIKRKNETLNWPLVPLSYGSGFTDDMRSVSRYGRLTGLKRIRRGRNIEITPYVIRGAQQVREDLSIRDTESDATTDVGVDLKYSVTSNLTLDLTVNTDFAQVEADNARLNLTRFSLFFPEKRQFFLERSGLFEHGASRRTQTFFSRTIGLTEDILAGTRVTGQLGRFSVGFLNIQTGNGMDQLFGSNSANNLVARVKTDLFPRATAGVILTNKTQGDAWNTAVGFDTQIRFWSRSNFEAWYTDVRDADPDLEDRAGYVGLSLRNAIYGASYSFTSVGKNYRPAMGFVRRRDMRQHSGSVTYSPILSEGPFRQITFQTSGAYITGQDNEKQSWQINSSLNFRLRLSDSFRINGSRGFERLDQPFFIRPGAEIPAGDYIANRISSRVTTDQGRPFSLWISVGGGQFFHGTRTDFSGNVGVKPSKHLSFNSTLSYSKVALPIDNGTFSATTASLDILASVSRKLFAKALIQYDNFSRNLRANVRIDWIHTPGSDLFLVFNTSYHLTESQEDLFDPNRDLIMNNAVGVAKLTYLIML